MYFIKKIKISVIIAFIISFVFSVVSFAKTSVKIRNDVLRLHVIANSDSSIDQNLKLRVRDAVLESGAEIFDGSVNVNNAVEKIKPKLNEFEQTAEETIKKNGFNYPVKIYLKREFFTTRTYDTVTLPAGEYLALKIVIGEGRGHNWWCVMFPPMCLPAADKNTEITQVFDNDEIRLVLRKPRYEMRFKVIEIYEDIKNRINERK